MDNWPETNDSLILRVKNPADANAWSAFLSIYRPVVYRLARSRGLQHADAEDLAQQVFLSVARAIDGWEAGPDLPPFRVWLGRISRNAIVNAITRRKPDAAAGSTSVQEILNQVPDPNDQTTKEVIQQSRLQATRWAADQIQDEFSEATWDMFWQTAIEGQSVTAVAKSLNRTRGAVYIARYRVMRRLKQKVNEVSDVWSEES